MPPSMPQEGMSVLASHTTLRRMKGTQSSPLVPAEPRGWPHYMGTRVTQAWPGSNKKWFWIQDEWCKHTHSAASLLGTRGQLPGETNW